MVHKTHTDTGLTLNFHAVAPKRYKRSVVSGLVYRIFRACSTWESFHESLMKAKTILENNQYPAEFYDPIISDTLKKIIDREITPTEESEKEEETNEHVLKLLADEYDYSVSSNTRASKRKRKALCNAIGATVLLSYVPLP